MVVRTVVACGFNAHSQIPSDASFIKSGKPPSKEDVKPAQIVMGSHSEVVILYVGWSDTLFVMDGDIYWFGAGCSSREPLDWVLGDWKPDNIQVFGDHTGPRALIGANGIIWWIHQTSSGKPDLIEEAQSPVSEDGSRDAIDRIAVAGNGQVAIVINDRDIWVYNDLEHLKQRSLRPPVRQYNIPTKCIKQIVANETAFAILMSEGNVWTWGDPRFSLGREITDTTPADEPFSVSDLEWLSVVKIAAGGNLMAAVGFHDLYIWGRTVAGGGYEVEFAPESSEAAEMVDLGDDVHVVDVEVGAGHIAALTSNGEVYTAGRNENGQTGIDTDGKFQQKWQKLAKVWDGKAKVYSGSSSWNTLIIAEE